MSTNRPRPTIVTTPPHAHAALTSGEASPRELRNSDGFRFRDLVLIARRRAVLVVGVTAACVALATYIVLRERVTYRALAVLRLIDTRRSVTQGFENRDADPRSWSNPQLSQMQLLKSNAIVGRVVDVEGLRLQPTTAALSPALLRQVQIDSAVPADTFQLRLSRDSVTVRNGSHEVRVAYRVPFKTAGVSFVIDSNPGIPEATLVLLSREQAIDELRTALRVSPREETDIVDVSYVHDDPAIAQRVVNRLVTVFQDENVRAAQGQSRRRRVFLEEQLREINGQLTRAQGALTSFRTRQQVYSSREKLQAQQAALMTLDMRREELGADRRMYQSVLSALEAPRSSRTDEELRALVAAPDLTANPVITQLHQQLSQYQSTRDSLTTGEWRSAASNPDVTRLDQLIRGAQQRMVGAVRGHIATIDSKLDALGTLRSRSAAAVEALPHAESVEEQLVRQVDANRGMADRLREEYQKARMAEAVEVGQVEIVDLASLPYRTTGRMALLKLLLGFMMGLLLGGSGAVVLEGANVRIHRRGELEQELNLPVLAMIPRADVAPSSNWRRPRFPLHLRHITGDGASTENAAPDPRSDTSPLSPGASEAFRLLRSSLKWSYGSAGDADAARTLLVTSARPEEGKTTTAANLAVSFALEGSRVLLVDCDLRRPRLHRVFRVPRDPGLAQVLRGYLPMSSAVRSTVSSGLWFLPAGRYTADSADLLGSARMRTLLGEMTDRFDMVILDSPPLLAVADAASLASLTDSVLLVVRVGETDRGAVEHALQQLGAVGARVIGAVLNDAHGEGPRYGEYYYHDNYALAK